MDQLRPWHRVTRSPRLRRAAKRRRGDTAWRRRPFQQRLPTCTASGQRRESRRSRSCHEYPSATAAGHAAAATRLHRRDGQTLRQHHAARHARRGGHFELRDGLAHASRRARPLRHLRRDRSNEETLRPRRSRAEKSRLRSPVPACASFGRTRRALHRTQHARLQPWRRERSQSLGSPRCDQRRPRQNGPPDRPTHRRAHQRPPLTRPARQHAARVGRRIRPHTLRPRQQRP